MLKLMNYGILMIRPASFQFNNETAINNFFQKKDVRNDVQELVLNEFDAFVDLLKKNKVQVDVINDTPDVVRPDAVFPNNWIGLFPNGVITLFPMFAENRRLEKRPEIVEWLKQKYRVKGVADLSHFEKEGEFMEGTGSLIFDHDNKIVYAALSPRTTTDVTQKFAQGIGYQLVLFKAKDAGSNEIYHTNVIMTLAKDYCIICLQAITEGEEKKRLISSLKNTGKEIIEITFEQMENFCGNALQVMNTDGTHLLVCSQTAYRNFTESQLMILQKYNPIISADIHTIETIGGGSARCMMAENYLQPEPEKF